MLSALARDCFGATYFRFFGTTKPYIDLKKKAGHSKLPQPTLNDWLWSAATLRHVWSSPSSLWSIFALLMYAYFPYDLSPSGAAARHGPVSLAFFAARFPVWAGLTLLYTGFWHVSLHILQWAKRPLVPGRPYNVCKVAHNVAYGLSGVAIWTVFDNVLAYLWATGRLPYMSDAEAFGSVSGVARFLAGLVLIPLWRDIHFYFSHRFLHYRPMYRQVHSVHHRNVDPEPFAGLSMHAIEHLYYFACVLPNLVLYASPFAALWNGVHLLISPAAGHSGFEDHWQANNFHYNHHRFPECNYAGSTCTFVDIYFGSFRERLADAEQEEEQREGSDGGDVQSQQQQGRDEVPTQPAQVMDHKATLRGLPTLEACLYLFLSLSCLAIWALAANALARTHVPVSAASAAGLGILAGFGPVAIACVFSAVLDGGGGGTPWFPREANRSLGALTHIVVGTLFSAVPIAYMCYLALLSPPQELLF